MQCNSNYLRALAVKYNEQEVGDDLRVFVLNLFPKVNIKPSLVTLGLMKVAIKFFEIFNQRIL